MGILGIILALIMLFFGTIFYIACLYVGLVSLVLFIFTGGGLKWILAIIACFINPFLGFCCLLLCFALQGL